MAWNNNLQACQRQELGQGHPQAPSPPLPTSPLPMTAGNAQACMSTLRSSWFPHSLQASPTPNTESLTRTPFSCSEPQTEILPSTQIYSFSLDSTHSTTCRPGPLSKCFDSSGWNPDGQPAPTVRLVPCTISLPLPCFPLTAMGPTMPCNTKPDNGRDRAWLPPCSGVGMIAITVRTKHKLTSPQIVIAPNNYRKMQCQPAWGTLKARGRSLGWERRGELSGHG